MTIMRFGKDISDNPAAMALHAMQNKLIKECWGLRGEEKRVKAQQICDLDESICLAVHGFGIDLYPWWYKLESMKKDLAFHLQSVETLREEIAELEKKFE
jgi:hypothetical protein